MYSEQLVSRRNFLQLMGVGGIGMIGAIIGIQHWKKLSNPFSLEVSSKGDGYEIINAPIDLLLDQHWNNIASDSPDKTDTKIVYLRTSPDQIPLERSLMIEQNQLVFIPWRTAQYDKDDGITKDKWINTAWNDMKAGDQDAIITINGHKVTPTFSEPHFTSTVVSPNAKVKLMIPFKKPLLEEVRESVTTGYGLLVKLAKGNHQIASSFIGSNNYKSSGRWSITVV